MKEQMIMGPESEGHRIWQDGAITGIFRRHVAPGLRTIRKSPAPVKMKSNVDGKGSREDKIIRTGGNILPEYL